VTQAQWQAVMGSNPSSFKDCGGNCPVEQVSWDDTQKFIQRLNGMNDGYTYRLPTEAEWEYACRAGTTGDYAGDLKTMAWYGGKFGSKPHPVGTKLANAFGLFDMHGNVWEWCQDWYSPNYYANSPSANPAGPSSGQRRVIRGGSLENNAADVRSATRLHWLPDIPTGFVDIGFRVVATARTQ